MVRATIHHPVMLRFYHGSDRKVGSILCLEGLAMKKTMVELFAGVGGFRVGMDRLDSGWETNWFSQWEPGKKKQWAHECYVQHYGDAPDLSGNYTTGIDIGEVDKFDVPEHSLLVGGFPCQDYSVAHPLSSSHGIEGKKGVLWWQIRDVLIAKRPPFVILENVDRLLKSPASQRGRDFGIILTCFAQLGYRVEWRVVNAAEYGAAQRRRRVFIFAYNKDTNYAKEIDTTNAFDIVSAKGFMVQAFPVDSIGGSTVSQVPVADLTQLDRREVLENGTDDSDNDLIYITNHFAFPFKNAGFMRDGDITTMEVIPKQEAPILLKDILESDVDESFYITSDKMEKWSYMKGAKKINRTSKSGHSYVFSEGPIAFPDPWDRPGRTMLTSESTLNRSTHIVADPATGRLRTLTPVEAERLQGFPDNWTNTDMPQRMRFFCMGNALVVPMISRMGEVLDSIIDNEK